MVAIEGDSNCCDSSDTRSLHSDSEIESYNYPQFNPKIDGDNPILALELTFGSKREFKDVVATHEIKKKVSLKLLMIFFHIFSLKKALWAATKATTVQQFIVCMNHMFELDPNVVAWCNEKEPSQ
ncbi:hypothetical protein H5410_060240 [Solanum commersonii]|uniref:Uncharacterized protein n=1 Tax=Solanum commersonii TaxID=4109 RepID=A0A9J5W4N7_SOLCO|nr:hypothetical protein H5410_060240 [Solanum commersonii]